MSLRLSTLLLLTILTFSWRFWFHCTVFVFKDSLLFNPTWASSWKRLVSKRVDWIMCTPSLKKLDSLLLGVSLPLKDFITVIFLQLFQCILCNFSFNFNGEHLFFTTVQTAEKGNRIGCSRSTSFNSTIWWGNIFLNHYFGNDRTEKQDVCAAHNFLAVEHIQLALMLWKWQHPNTLTMEMVQQTQEHFNRLAYSF